MQKIILKNEKELRSFAESFVKKLKGGETVALTGDLGSGKTTFTKAVAHHLNIKDTITSPTFNIMKLYSIPKNKQLLSNKLCHVDAYRLDNKKDLSELDIKSYIQSLNTITIIEWAEKIKNILPKNTIFINLNIGKNHNERIVKIK